VQLSFLCFHPSIYFSLDERAGDLRDGGGHRTSDPDPGGRGVDAVRVRGVREEPRGDAGGGGLGGGQEGLRRPALPGRPGEPRLRRMRRVLAPAGPAPAACMIRMLVKWIFWQKKKITAVACLAVQEFWQLAFIES
jgi:hypothetical protein